MKTVESQKVSFNSVGLLSPSMETLTYSDSFIDLSLRDDLSHSQPLGLTWACLHFHVQSTLPIYLKVFIHPCTLFFFCLNGLANSPLCRLVLFIPNFCNYKRGKLVIQVLKYVASFSNIFPHV